MMWLDKNKNLLLTLRDVTAATVLPVTLLVDSPTQVSEWAKNKLQTNQELQENNKKLKQSIIKLKRKIQKLSLLDIEIQKYKKLLFASKEIPDFVKATRIYQVNLHRHKHLIKINMGRSDCVYQDQALIDAYGIMGQVIQVHYKSSIVRLLTDQNHIMPIQFKIVAKDSKNKSDPTEITDPTDNNKNRLGIRTIAYGTGKQWLIKLPNLSISTDVEVGQEIVSSGLGQIYPFGYSVGKVIEIKNSPGAKFKIAFVKPSARLNQTRDALLVWSDGVIKKNKRIKKCLELSKNAAKK